MVFRDGSLACFLTRVLLPTPILLSPVSGLFLPLIFLCTASGYFLRPATVCHKAAARLVALWR